MRLLLLITIPYVISIIGPGLILANFISKNTSCTSACTICKFTTLEAGQNLYVWLYNCPASESYSYARQRLLKKEINNGVYRTVQ